MTVLAGRYELGPSLGGGGMASVVAGHDRLLDRPVAVKLLDRTVDQDARQRFLREARAAARLHHVNAVQVFDTGEHDGRPYIVMEHVHGVSAADRLREGHLFDIEEAVAITLGVLSALSAAHEVGILHRDVKPANVLLPDDGGVKLADFGIAKAMGAATRALTATGTVVGTAAYLAPEVVEGRAASPASDLYGTGCLLYELLTGEPPFHGDSAISVAYAHTRVPAPPVEDRRPDVPDDLALVVARALAKDPEERFPSAEAMSHALLEGPEPESPAAATLPLAAGIGAVTDAAASDVTASDVTASDVEPEPGRPGPALALLAAIAVLAVVAALAIALLRANGEVAGDEPGEQADADLEDVGDTDAGDTEPPPGDEPQGNAPSGDDLPADGPPALGDLMGQLASAPEDHFGEKQDDLLEDLRDLIRESDRASQAEDARDLREDLAEWVDKGEIDPAIAAEADEFLAPIASAD